MGDQERAPATDGAGRSDPDAERERPEWWRRADEEFESRDLGPYRPPRFSDGTPKHEVVEPLEREHGVDIRFLSFEPEPDGDWDVRIDGTPAFEVGHRRHRAGYSIFEITAEEFESRVRRRLDSDG